MMQVDTANRFTPLTAAGTHGSLFSPRKSPLPLKSTVTVSTPNRRTSGYLSGVGASTPTPVVTSPFASSQFSGGRHHGFRQINSPSSHTQSSSPAHLAASATLRSSAGTVGGGDRFIPDRDAHDTRFAQYLLTSPLSDQLPRQLGGGGHSNIGTVAGGGRGGGGSTTAPVTSVLEASSPAFAGSPNASPNRHQRGRPRRGSEIDGDTAESGPSQPYSGTLAKALFSESSAMSVDNVGADALAASTSSQMMGLSSVTTAGGGGAMGGKSVSVLGFKSPNYPRSSGRLSSGAGKSMIGSGIADDESDNARRASSLHVHAQAGVSQSQLFSRSRGVVYQENRARNFQSKSFRVIPQTPERILDAPELLDDFYLNLLDWSSSNTLAVALGSTVYLWSAADGSIVQLMSSSQQRDNMITAVTWHGEGQHVAIGLNDGTVELWDAEAQQQIRTFSGHSARVCSLGWNGSLLASGSRDTRIHLHDHRDPSVSGSVQGHTQEVCGLRWNSATRGEVRAGGAAGGGYGNATQLASGGNDNLLNIWDLRRSTNEVAPLWQFRDHTAAVKALAWNPRQSNLLVSGGGTADKTLRFWDTLRGECINVVDTLSQVCGVLWSHDGTELISSHGYSDNQLTIWKYPTMKRLAELTGHTSRVLHLAMSPDGQTVVSAAGDETIRFWRCFAPDPATLAAESVATNPFLVGSPSRTYHTSSAAGSPVKRKRESGAASPKSGSSLVFGDFDELEGGELR